MRSLTCRCCAVEQVGGDDLEVVVGGVGEGAAAVAVAERPDAGDVGGQALVDRDVAARVGRDAGASSAEVVGVRPPADGQQHVRSDGLAVGPSAQSTETATPSLVRREADALGVGADRDALALPGSPEPPRDTSSSSRAISRGAFSTTVTSAPKRRYICANSRPM